MLSFMNDREPLSDFERALKELGVRHRTSHILSVKNILARNLGLRMKRDGDYHVSLLPYSKLKLSIS
jgi:hypothetical protein